MSKSVCGNLVSHRRGLLALLWFCVNLLSAIAFLTALLFSIYATNDEDDYQYYYQQEQEGEAGGSQDQAQEEEQKAEVAVTSRAMAFAALWTAVLASLMAVFGTVILGFQSPTGEYYTCCDPNVHRTSQLGLGSFIGALLMFANLTLVCSVLFGEFQIRDFKYEEVDGEQRRVYNSNVQRTSIVFSIMCMFLTILYGGFAVVTYLSAKTVLEETEQDVNNWANEQNANTTTGVYHPHNGYIDGRFDVMPPSGFRSTQAADRTTRLLPEGDFVGVQTPLSMTDSQGSNSTQGVYGRQTTSGSYNEPQPLFSNGASDNEAAFQGMGSNESTAAEPNPFKDHQIT